MHLCLHPCSLPQTAPPVLHRLSPITPTVGSLNPRGSAGSGDPRGPHLRAAVPEEHAQCGQGASTPPSSHPGAPQSRGSPHPLEPPISPSWITPLRLPSPAHGPGGLWQRLQLRSAALKSLADISSFGERRELSAAPRGSSRARRAAALIALISVLPAGAEACGTACLDGDHMESIHHPALRRGWRRERFY